MCKMSFSIIVPAYNEERRLPFFLPDLMDFAKQTRECKEVIFVNDGSTDKTLEYIEQYTKDEKKVKIITYEKNNGKGWAVKQGVDKAEGDMILFIDADGSIHPNQIPLMLEKLKTTDIVVGDRSARESKIEQPFVRRSVGKIFNVYVALLFQSRQLDNLCGFKGFQKNIAKDLFSNLQSHNWIFDVEIFYKAKQRRYKIYRLPIFWKHKEETKLKPYDPIKMLFQLLLLRYKLLIKDSYSEKSK